MSLYDELIDQCAHVLRAKMREAVGEGREGDLNVFAIRTTHDRDGYFHIGYDYPPNVDFRDYEVVRPFGYPRWSAVPYSNMRSQLTHVCRRVPFLPISRSNLVRQPLPEYARVA